MSPTKPVQSVAHKTCTIYHPHNLSPTKHCTIYHPQNLHIQSSVQSVAHKTCTICHPQNLYRLSPTKPAQSVIQVPTTRLEALTTWSSSSPSSPSKSGRSHWPPGAILPWRSERSSMPGLAACRENTEPAEPGGKKQRLLLDPERNCGLGWEHG